MIPILTTQESREYDQHLIEELHIPSVDLMERAAEAVCEVVRSNLEGAAQRQILICCGTGNNGGDGLAVARLLTEAGERPHVIICGDAAKFSTDAAEQFDRLKSMASIERIEFMAEGLRFEREPDARLIIVDALLGTGARGPVREPIAGAIALIRQLRSETECFVISVDTPSGLDCEVGAWSVADDGDETVVIADQTVTMAAPKLGFFRQYASEVVGKLTIVPLIDEASQRPTSRTSLTEMTDVRSCYPGRVRVRSKFDLGHVLSVTGSRGMSGAAIMGAEAALRSGCGLVTVATAMGERATVAVAMPELMTIGLPESGTGAPTFEAFDDLKESIQRATVLLIGSGMRPEETTAKLLRRIMAEIELPIVVDAGALHALKGHLELITHPIGPRILTPHAGELAAMMGVPRSEVEADRFGAARRFCEAHDVTLVMKGAPSYIVSHRGEVVVNSTGGVGLATAGSGDVLAGIIAGTLAQDPTRSFVATWIGSFIHGFAADLAQSELTSIGMTARDITRHLGAAYKSIGLV